MLNTWTCPTICVYFLYETASADRLCNIDLHRSNGPASRRDTQKHLLGGGSYYVDDSQIQQLYFWLDSIPNLLDKYDIYLISHTDPIGGKEYNDWLSKMRSEAVQQILLQKAVPERKITIKDWGLENPVYSNTSYQGMEMNRRVDVILYPILF